MRSELLRQVVHAGGIFFIFLAWFLDKFLLSMMLLSISIFFLIYSEYVIRKERSWVGIVNRIEGKIRDFATWLERDHVKRPFLGAFWFYFACSFAFFFYSLSIATVSCMILAVADAASTLVGRKGRIRIIQNKTLEGTIVFFITSLFVSIFFLNIYLSMIAAITATLSEVFPDIFNEKWRMFIDDNWTIPLITGFILTLTM
ncbi:MAG: hypothetical protein DRP15_00145 [Candidatus Aenigmatarchaeota archaeon]|nr:MAG: hypothetical protein DRP15_00145 [Candidatus Aenigmarchaeota archaeon]